MTKMKKYTAELVCLVVVVFIYLATQSSINPVIFSAGFVVLQFVVMATAWNILGGYAGYVNFGSAGFLAVGAYTAVALIEWIGLSLIPQIIAGGIVAGLLGLATGYLTLRLRGVYFAIATLALAVVLETVAANWEFVGGAAGIALLPPRKPELLGLAIVDARGAVLGDYIRAFFSPNTEEAKALADKSFAVFNDRKELLFFLMGAIAVVSLYVARTIETSKLGRGLNAIKDSEEAAECMGVPTLRLKLIATTISGAMMGVAGAPYITYVTYIDPLSAFSLDYAVNAIAMPMIGGTISWAGPLIGALLLGSAQQYATLYFSSVYNLLIVGVLLVVFIIIAPSGILGWFKSETFKRFVRMIVGWFRHSG